MESQPLFTLSIHEAKSFIKDWVNQCLQENKPETPVNNLPKYYSRKEVAKMLGLSLPTLDSYTSQGLIKSGRIGNRILYSEEDIQNALDNGPVKYARRPKGSK